MFAATMLALTRRRADFTPFPSSMGIRSMTMRCLPIVDVPNSGAGGDFDLLVSVGLEDDAGDAVALKH